MTSNNVQIILQILTILVGLYLALFKSYFQEKGKNIATQEDIGKITKAVEDVKKQFTIETEILRNNLNLFSGSFQSIKNLERTALIEMNLKYSQWLQSLKNFSLAYYSYDFYEPLLQKHLYFSEKQTEFDIAEDNLHLYVHDPELMSLKKEITTATYKLHLSVISNILSFVLNCQNYNRILENRDNRDTLEENKKYHEQQQPVIDKSIQEMVSCYQEILPHQIKFTKALNQRIYSLIS